MTELLKIPYIITGSFIDEHEIVFTGFTVCYGQLHEAQESQFSSLTQYVFKLLRSICTDINGHWTSNNRSFMIKGLSPLLGEYVQ